MREREEWDEGSAGCGRGHAQNKTKQNEDRKPRKKEHTNGTPNRETEKGRLIDSSTHRLIIISMRFKRAENVKPKQVTPRVETSKSQVLADLDLPHRAKITHAGRGREQNLPQHTFDDPPLFSLLPLSVVFSPFSGFGLEFRIH